MGARSKPIICHPSYTSHPCYTESECATVQSLQSQEQGIWVGLRQKWDGPLGQDSLKYQTLDDKIFTPDIGDDENTKVIAGARGAHLAARLTV